MNTCVYLSYKGLGANLLHLTYCHEISKKFGPVTIITLCKNLKDALKDDPQIKEIYFLDKYHKKFFDIFKLSKILNEFKFDQIFIYYPSLRIYIAAKLAGIKKIFHYPFNKNKLHLVKAAKEFTCKTININNCPTETKIFLKKEKIDKVKKYFQDNKFNIVIGAGSSGPDTRWGSKNFSKLINKLNEIGNYFFFIQCGPDQKEISQEIVKNIKKKNYLDISELNIDEIMPYLNLCDMYVGNDTFSHHVTSQSQKPSIVLLLNTPKAYSDYSMYHHRITPDNIKIEDINHNSNFNPESISVEKVINKIIQIKN
tara:strand:+ start:2404 stop:3339 length:936 start_codon:yes stop_codon:yes gene_type:complete